MPLTVRIFPEYRIVYVKQRGRALIDENLEGMMRVSQMKGFQPAMTHLIDLAEVTSWERDFVRFFEMQARAVSLLLPKEGELLVVFYAPTRTANEMVRLAQKSWDGIDGIRLLMLEDEDQVIDVLRLPVRSLRDLEAPAD